MPFEPRKDAYDADITYGTNSEFGFDYLRDNMAIVARGRRAARPRVRDRGRGRLDPHRRGAHAADHLRRAETAAQIYYDFARIVPQLVGASLEPGRPKGADEARTAPTTSTTRSTRPSPPTEQGVEKVERALRIENLYAPQNVAARQPPDPGAEGAVALQARRRLRRPGRRGEDRRRVHRPHHGRPPLERGPAPGGRGEGGRPRSRRSTRRSRRSRCRTTSASTRSSAA